MNERTQLGLARPLAERYGRYGACAFGNAIQWRPGRSLSFALRMQCACTARCNKTQRNLIRAGNYMYVLYVNDFLGLQAIMLAFANLIWLGASCIRVAAAVSCTLMREMRK